MKTSLRSASCFFFSAVALLLVANAPVVSSRLSGGGASSTSSDTNHRHIATTNNNFKVSFDSTKSSYAACPSASLVATVLNRTNNRPLSNKKVTLSIVASATATTPAATLKRVARTSSSGKAAFDYSLTSQQMQDWSGRKLKCSIRVDNPLVSGGFQTLACPKDVQLCTVPNCADTVGAVICQGDMAFDTLCDAVAAGIYPDQCVPDDQYQPDCEQLAGYVKCAGTEWYDSLCAAVAQGYAMDSCEQVDDSLVPDCAKSGQVLCQGTTVFNNLCAAATSGMAPEDCVPSP
jgi:hypothetical protein